MRICKSHLITINSIGLLALVTAALAAPVARFDSELLYFGEVVTGTPITAEFKLTNAGDADLEITQIRPGCGCTKAEAGKNKLAPGESTTINALFDTTGFSGEVNKAVTVMTNDPTRGTFHLLIKAQLVSLAKVKPQNLNFGSLKVNSNRTFMVLIYPTKPDVLEITRVEVQGARTSVPSYKKVESPNGAYWQLFVSVKADDKPGRVMESVKVFTNLGETATVGFQVFGNTIE